MMRHCVSAVRRACAGTTGITASSQWGFKRLYHRRFAAAAVSGSLPTGKPHGATHFSALSAKDAVPEKLLRTPSKVDSLDRIDFEKAVEGTITRCEVDILGGILSIGTSLEGAASLRAQYLEECDPSLLPSFSLDDDGTLLVTSTSLKGFAKQTDPFVYDLKVPPSCALDINLRAGNVYLDGIPNDVTVHMYAGNCTGTCTGRFIHVSNKAGDIRLHGLSPTTLSANAAAGEVACVFDSLPDGAKIACSVQVGDVSLVFPHGTVRPQRGSTTMYTYEGGASVHASARLGGVHVYVRPQE